jgi:hypothetical protein
MVPAFQTTVLTGVHGNGDMTDDVTFFGMLFEGDLLISSNDSSGFAKEAVVCVLGRVHAGLRSVMNSTIVSHNGRLPSVNYFTYEGLETAFHTPA